MIPKRVVVENFLSFGSPAVEIVFADDEPLWVVGGPNGVGKSAVFDAMTYALYAAHRGGASDHDRLVRHGANGFRVAFEFEFNGTDYRISRTRPRAGRPTQRIEKRTEGGWAAVDLPTAAGRQDAVRAWTERTLGLSFDAFRASVLLRQGQADEIITAGGTDRLNTLKEIIGVERFELLSKRVHEATKRRRDRLADLRVKRRRGVGRPRGAGVSPPGARPRGRHLCDGQGAGGRGRDPGAAGAAVGGTRPAGGGAPAADRRRRRPRRGRRPPLGREGAARRANGRRKGTASRGRATDGDCRRGGPAPRCAR